MVDLSEKANLGVAGLDDITKGGLARGRLFLARDRFGIKRNARA